MATMKLSQSQSSDLTDLGQWVLRTFKDWADNRRSLETKWQANRDAFRGLDDASWGDPDADNHDDGGEDGNTTFKGKKDWHSTHTMRLTKQKVMTAFALVIDAVLQGGRVPFMLKLAGELQVNHEDLPPDAAEHIDDEVTDMTQRIQQQLDRCDATRQLARAVLSAAIYGRARVKFRPKTFKARRMVALPQQPMVDQATGQPVMDPATGQPAMAPDQWTVEVAPELSPGVTFVSIWDVFDDVEAEDSRDSAGVIHRQYVSPRQFRAMAGEGPGWDQEAVTRALRESNRGAPSHGDGTAEMTPRLRDVSTRKNVIRVLECWMQVPRAYADRYEQGTPDDSMIGDEIREAEETGDDVPCLVVMAGDEVVRFIRLNPDEPWPFYSIPWEEDIDEAETYGVADNLAQTQAVLNSAIRAFEDNKRFSSSVILGLKRRMMLNPGWDGKIKPGLVLDVAEEARSIGDALSAFIVPDVGANLLQLIQLFSEFGDEESMVPKIQGGGRDSQQTAYEASIRVEKAGKYMGAVVRNFDNFLIGPMIRDFYEWNMLDPQVQTGKGAFDITPLGFTSFQDRVIRLQAIQQFLAIVLQDPELRKMVKLDDALREIAKSLDLDPDQWLKSVKQMQDEAAQQNDIQTVLAVEDAKANIQKTQADTVKAKAETVAIGERLKIDRAKAVSELKEKAIKASEPPAAANPGNPAAPKSQS